MLFSCSWFLPPERKGNCKVELELSILFSSPWLCIFWIAAFMPRLLSPSFPCGSTVCPSWHPPPTPTYTLYIYKYIYNSRGSFLLPFHVMSAVHKCKYFSTLEECAEMSYCLLSRKLWTRGFLERERNMYLLSYKSCKIYAFQKNCAYMSFLPKVIVHVLCLNISEPEMVLAL